jgi:hypothetical protein
MDNICIATQKNKGLQMWAARLNIHQKELKRNLEFTGYDKEFNKLKWKTIKSNIKYHTRLITKCRERIEYFKAK